MVNLVGYVLPGVFEVDTLLGGWQRVTSGYLVEGPAPVLVETGSQTSAPSVVEALGDHGVGPEDLAGVVVTHIHLDHAGAVGDIARTFPNATVYVHPKGARHLADPARLVGAAGAVYGALLDTLYGRMVATPAGRVKAVEDGHAIEIGGGRRLLVVHSPGHAKHHIALSDSATGALFVGDAVGVRLPEAGVLWPATPPDDFDLELALDSLGRFQAMNPSAIALAHYGVVPSQPADVLDEAVNRLREWASVAKAAWMAGRDVEEAMTARFAPELDGLDDVQRERMQTLNGLHSNTEGLKVWLKSREPGSAGQAGS